MVLNTGLLLRWVLFKYCAFFSLLYMDYNEMSWFRHRFHQLSKAGGGVCGTQEKQTELHCHS